LIRKAKRLSAANFDDAGHFGRVAARRAFATRDASLCSDGIGAPSSRILAVALLAVSALFLLLASAPAADAAPKKVAGIIGEETDAPGDPGEFRRPAGIAVNQATGDVYVVDRNRNRIQRFTADGVFISQFGSSGSEEGQFSFGEALPDVAIDPADGSVYVADSGNNRIQKFTEDGTFLYTFGWNVDIANPSEEFEICTDATAEPDCQASATFGGGDGDFNTPVGVTVDTSAGSVGDVLVADQFNSRIQRFDSSGNYISQFFAEDGEGSPIYPTRVGVDSTGNVYVYHPATFSDGRAGIYKFDASGVFIQKIAINPSTFSDCCPGSMTVDPVTDHVFVANQTFNESSSTVREFDAAGALIESHVVPGADSSSGIGFRSSTGYLYVSAASTEGSTKNQVFILTDTGATPPTVTISAPTEVDADSAVLHGTVDPNGGLPAKAHFELSTDGITWTRATPDVDIAKGDDPVAVDQTVTGLVPSTEYSVRLVANKGFGNPDAFSPLLTFETESIPPTATTLSTSVRGTTTASLFGRVNPSGQETTYFFEYGLTDSYGERSPDTDGVIPAGGADKIVSTSISGLEPGTTYHYRVVAENAEGSVAGLDETFETRPVASGPERAFEMVTPPFKATRSTVAIGGAVGNNANAGVASSDGESVSWSTAIFPLTEDVKSSADGDNRLIRRTPSGWIWKTMNTRAAKEKDGGAPLLSKQDGIGSNADFSTLAWSIENGELIASPGPKYSQLYTRRDGAGLDGFTAWLTNPDTQKVEGTQSGTADRAIFNDDGTAMARSGGYRGLEDDPATVADEDPSDNQQFPGSQGGRSVYLVRADNPNELPAAPKDLVNECTGTVAGGDATVVPTSSGGPQNCEEGQVVHKQGAILPEPSGNGDPATLSSPQMTLSDDGHRLFFLSPDPAAAPGCETPHLYVRQYDSSGKPTVRWLSRARGVSQQSGCIYATSFEGASRDGRFVYFKTNMRLLPNDVSSVTSWDLYRYELPGSLDADPDDGSLTRVSAGPTGTADPRTNSGNTKTGEAVGEGGALRYSSDDGKRAYFVTTMAISGADGTPPQGGITVPGGELDQNSFRNLYLFDDTGATPTYTFIARIPYSKEHSNVLNRNSLNACASFSSGYGNGHFVTTTALARSVGASNCFHGTKAGDHVIFFTLGQLTSDDDDAAGDIYSYDASRDQLTRISAPPPGAAPYQCQSDFVGNGEGDCNADFGVNLTGRDFNSKGPAGSLDGAGGWGRGRYYNVAEDANGVVSVFFATRVALIPEDTNGDHWDVYEWSEGRLSLVSPGNTEDDSFFSGNSTDGQDAFIFTSARIDPREIDDSDFDIYDARIGGGFPYTPPPRPCDVLGHQCRGAASQAPALTASPTQNPNGTGNVVAKKCAKGKVLKKGKCVAKKCRKGQVLRKGKCVKKQGAKNKAAAKNRGAK